MAGGSDAEAGHNTGMHRLAILLFAAIVFAASLAFALKDEAVEESVDQLGWPRLIEGDDMDLIVYQPQVDKWANHRVIDLSFAMEIKADGAEHAHFGSVEVKARTAVDFSDRTVVITKAKLTDINFPHAEKKQQDKYKKFVRKILAGRTWNTSLDRVLATVARTETAPREVKVSTLPPPIYYAEEDTLLLQFLGSPTFKPIPGTKLEYAVNTNWDVIRTGGGAQAFLLVEGGWYSTANVSRGPWSPVKELPAEFQLLPKDENWAVVREHVPGKQHEAAPRIYTALRPSELILVDGERELKKIEGTNLSYVTNTDEDLFWHATEKLWYYLVAGRWFSTPDLKNLAAWTTSNRLPKDFSKIPGDHEMADVRASVIGTPEAEEAVIQSMIPRKASVQRGGAELAVVYEGKPEFEEIKETGGVSFAVNTQSDVFQFNGTFYCCDNGIWFVAADAEGPWEMCDKVPAEIYSIPGEHGKHHCTYVQVYESNEDEIVYGYTGGYYGNYYYRGRIWFGYGHWWGFKHGLAWHHRYAWRHRPAHYAYGMGARYNPYRGGYVRGAITYGPYGGVGRGARYDIRTKTYARSRAAYGKAVNPRTLPAYNPATKSIAKAGQRVSVYGSWGKTAKARDNQWMATTRKQHNVHIAQKQAAQQQRAAMRPAPKRTNNLYTGKDGTVYRRHNGQWQVRGRSGWQAYKRPQQPTTRQRQMTTQQLNRQRGYRTRGRTRSTQYRVRPTYTSRRTSGHRRSRSYRGSRGGSRGGGARGGGGRR